MSTRHLTLGVQLIADLLGIDITNRDIKHIAISAQGNDLAIVTIREVLPFAPKASTKQYILVEAGKVAK